MINPMVKPAQQSVALYWRKRFIALSAIITLMSVFPSISAAHGPTRQVVKQQITINAPAAKVWAVVGDFFTIDQWHPAVLKTEKIDDKTRKLSLDEAGQATLIEVLKKLDDEKMRLKYKIIEMAISEEFDFNGIPVQRKTLPVDTYSSTIQVVPDGNQSVVTWTGKFYRAYLLNPPTPEGMDDATAISTINAVYVAGLENLAKQFDGEAAAKAAPVE